MYEYVCEQVMPTCPVRLQADRHEDVAEEAHRHLRESHDIEEIEDTVRTNVAAAIQRTYG